MRVRVHLFGGLRDYLPAASGFNSTELELAESATLAHLLACLSIPDTENYIVIIEDRKVDAANYANTPLGGAEEVSLLPVIKGG